jgi:CubicO group peptidase (beta-lactamase class C family)
MRRTPGGLEAVDDVVRAGVDARAFPGGVLAVGRGGALVHLRAFGKLAYDEDAAPVATDTIYDLASLTKVVVTTTLVRLARS